MSDTIGRQAASALTWRVVQLASTKGVFLVRTLILARLLAPDDFGLLAIATAAIGLLLSLTDLGIVPALVQRLERHDRHFDVAWTIGMLRAAVIGATVAIGAPLFAVAFDDPRATELIRVLAVLPLLDAAASIRIAEVTRQLRFRPLALLRLSEALAITVVAVGLAPALGVWALVAGQLAGGLTYLGGSYVVAPHRPRFGVDFDAARSLIRFGRWIFVTGVIAVIGNTLLQITIARTVGTVGLGLYVLAAKIAFLPAELASAVVGAVAFPLYARLQGDRSQIRRALQTSLLGMGVLLLPICALIFTVSPSLVSEVLGDQWAGTAPLIQILAVASMIGLFGEAVVPIFKGVGQPHKAAVAEFVQSGLLVLLIWVLAQKYGTLGVAIAWLPATAASQLVCVRLLQSVLLRPLAGLARPLGMVACTTAVGAVAAGAVTFALPGLPGVMTAVSVGVLTVAVGAFGLERRFELGLFSRLLTLSAASLAAQPAARRGPVA
jgi:lipopolysaccharide exporter